MPLECDDYVFWKVNWPLPLRRSRWVDFRLTAKLSLSVTKPNFRRSVIRNCSCFMGWHFRFQFLFFVNKNSKLCILRERTKIRIFWIFTKIFEYILNRHTAFPSHVSTRQLPRQMPAHIHFQDHIQEINAL